MDSQPCLVRSPHSPAAEQLNTAPSLAHWASECADFDAPTWTFPRLNCADEFCQPLSETFRYFG